MHILGRRGWCRYRFDAWIKRSYIFSMCICIFVVTYSCVKFNLCYLKHQPSYAMNVKIYFEKNEWKLYVSFQYASTLRNYIQYIIKYHTSTGINCTVWELQIDWYISAKYVWRILYYYTSPGLGISSSVFRANRSYFAQKWANEPFPQKNERFTHSLIFSEQPEQFAHDRSFPLSDLSE